MRAGQQSGMQHTAQFNVVNKGGLAGGDFKAIYFTLSFADYAQLGENTGLDRCWGPPPSRIFASPSTAGFTPLIRAGPAMLGMLQGRAPRVPWPEVLM